MMVSRKVRAVDASMSNLRPPVPCGGFAEGSSTANRTPSNGQRLSPGVPWDNLNDAAKSSIVDSTVSVRVVHLLV
jgi:hypothetical protein